MAQKHSRQARDVRSERQKRTTAETPTQAPLRRYVSKGVLVDVPEGATFAEDLRFVSLAAHRMTMMLVPAPTAALIEELVEAWQLHPALHEDLLAGVRRPKLDRYGDVTFIVLRLAWHAAESDEVEFAEFHVLLRPGAIIVLCHDGKWIDGTPAARVDDEMALRFHSRDQRLLLDDKHLLRLGSGALLYRLLDAVVDGYNPVLRDIEIGKEQIEHEVFSGNTAVAERIYRLSQEVVDMQHTMGALLALLREIRTGIEGSARQAELEEYLQDVTDQAQYQHTRITDVRESLAQILNVNSSLIALRQGENAQKISGWAAVIFAPSLVAAIYGMNFISMPELDWRLGYPFAIFLMLAFAGLLYMIFKARKWM